MDDNREEEHTANTALCTLCSRAQALISEIYRLKARISPLIRRARRGKRTPVYALPPSCRTASRMSSIRSKIQSTKACSSTSSTSRCDRALGCKPLRCTGAEPRQTAPPDSTRRAAEPGGVRRARGGEQRAPGPVGALRLPANADRGLAARSAGLSTLRPPRETSQRLLLTDRRCIRARLRLSSHRTCSASLLPRQDELRENYLPLLERYFQARAGAAKPEARTPRRAARSAASPGPRPRLSAQLFDRVVRYHQDAIRFLEDLQARAGRARARLSAPRRTRLRASPAPRGRRLPCASPILRWRSREVRELGLADASPPYPTPHPHTPRRRGCTSSTPSRAS